MTALAKAGWCRLPWHQETARWAAAARALGAQVTRDPAMRARWLDCEGTWFVGVDALPSGPDGAVAGCALGGPAGALLTPHRPLHPAQLSVVYPGYPRPRGGESAAAFRYRRDRDAAHVDGVIRGPDNRRRVSEPHAFILGLPLTECDPEAAPLVVWEGSHSVMRDTFRRAFADLPPETWPARDVTELYQKGRRHAFETCPRVALHARPGEALLVHRLTLHGVAPWAEGSQAPPEGRMIAYFRPILPGGIVDWLDPRL